MNCLDALVESWHKQCRCVSNLVDKFDDRLLQVKSADDGWTAAMHFAHTHGVRLYWLRQVGKSEFPEIGSLYDKSTEEWTAIADLAQIKARLKESEDGVAKWVREAVESGVERCEPYDHPIYFLQHMVWHDGYHFSSLMQCLRNGGAEPDEEWEELNIWAQWRDAEI